MGFIKGGKILKNGRMWGFLIPLSGSWEMSLEHAKTMPLKFDDSVWESIIEEIKKTEINTVVFDCLDGICYGSHPEISMPGAWSRGRLRKEIKRLEELGIKAIPKLNFSATHDSWLGEYQKMISTTTYYKVCRDLIIEVYELFNHPEYIHLGMDEEGLIRYFQAPPNGLIRARFGDAMWKDLRYFVDCVKDVGATPWIWSDLMYNYTNEFMERFSSDEIVVSPWYYCGMKREHYMLISDRQATIEHYSQKRYEGMNLKYVEDDPWCVDFRKDSIDCAKYGYRQIPCGSLINCCYENYEDIIDCFENCVGDKELLGFMGTSWLPVLPENQDAILENIRYLQKAIIKNRKI